MSSDQSRLRDIRSAIENIREFMAIGEEAFARSKVHQHAVLRNFMVIGEAANRLSETTRQRAPHIPWYAVISTRNRLVHDYDIIDLEIIVETVRDDLPILYETANRLLTEISDP